jgi:hypothetical protein
MAGFFRRLIRTESEEATGGSYVLLRSRFQPVTYGHLEAITYFFKKLSPELAEKTERTPTLVLAIVCDLLRGSELGRQIALLAEAEKDSRLAHYLSRFRPEFNPLMPLEVIEDLLALVYALPRNWRQRIAITLIPEFGCTVFSLHSPHIGQDAAYLLKELLPAEDQRRWLIPLFDNDDDKDLRIASDLGEDVLVYSPIAESSSSKYGFQIGSENGVGLYGYSTFCVLTDDRNALKKLMPKSVYKRWGRQNVFSLARARSISFLDGANKTLAVALAELRESVSFKSISSNRPFEKMPKKPPEEPGSNGPHQNPPEDAVGLRDRYFQDDGWGE